LNGLNKEWLEAVHIEYCTPKNGETLPHQKKQPRYYK